jgi:4-amino-4-deoxy-L-arabinose transferase-like glycosyltransferase
MPAESAGTASSARWAAALLAAAVCAALYGGRLNRPLERSLSSSSTNYMVLFFRNWDEAGFAHLKGVPTVGTGGATLAERVPYLHHPPLAYWLIYGARLVGGWTEWAFRLVPYLATVLASALTVLLAARLVGPIWGLGAGLLFTLLPMTFAFGLMTNSDPLVVAWLLGGFLLHLRLRDRPDASRRWALRGWYFVGCFIEWQVWFLLPALLLFELTRPRGERSMGEVFKLIPVAVSALGIIASHYAWALGSFEALVDDLQGTIRKTLETIPGRSLSGFLANQLTAWLRFFGAPMLVVSGALLLAMIGRPRRLRSETGGLLCALALPAALAIGLFRTPAYDHAFFWMPLAIFLPAATVVSLRAVSGPRPGLAAVLTIGVFGWCLALDIEHDTRSRSTLYPELGALVNRIADADDLVLTPEPVSPTMFYTRAHFHGDMTPAWRIEQILSRDRRFFDRVFLWMHPHSRDDDPSCAEVAAWAAENGTELPVPGVLVWVIE